MHPSSLEKLVAVRDIYGRTDAPRKDGRLRILDIGSMSYELQDSYRPLFSEDDYEYIGLDLAEGPNVDIVPKDPYSWSEIASESFDLVISGQTFEHNPFFWITFAEIARVLKVHGIAAITAPSQGPVHRYPYDCWRFYPDSWAALTRYVGLDLLEQYTEQDTHDKVIGGLEWGDSIVIAQRPELSPIASGLFYDRLARICDTRVEQPHPAADDHVIGPALSLYESRNAVNKAQYNRFRIRLFGYKCHREAQRLMKLFSSLKDSDD